MDKKCKYCQKDDCKKYKYRIVKVMFDKEYNCTIERDMLTEDQAVELFKKFKLPTIIMNDKESIVEFNFMTYSNIYSMTGHRIDTKHGFYIIYKNDSLTKVDNIDIQFHFDCWINNKVTNGRFAQTEEGEECDFESYIVTSSSALQYANLYEKVAKLRVSFIRELFDIKNTNKGNNDKFHNSVPFDIHKPVYCSCGKELEFKYTSVMSGSMYAECECGKHYHALAERVYRKVDLE